MSTTATDDIAVAPEDGPVEVAARRYRGGWRIVARKEFADHVHSARFVILIILLGLAGLASVHSASGPIRDAADKASSTPSIFLYLFTLSPDRVPSFYEFIGILGPLLGIAFGFDAINGERSLGTLPRLVAQPIHRDEIINGKFVAGIGAIALGLGCLITMVGGYGALRLGVGPTWSDVIRLIAYFAVAVVYISLWLALAILLSVTCRRAATAALAALAVWLVLTLFAGLIAGIVADSWHSIDSESTTEEVLANARTELNVRRLSPDQLYKDATGVLLNPSLQTTGIVTPPASTDTAATTGALPSSLPLSESLALAWWQLVVLVAGTIAVFAAAYLVFLRQEVRA
jgi:ABC-2 type transport system permease protein